jgi:hypothetical protein
MAEAVPRPLPEADADPVDDAVSETAAEAVVAPVAVLVAEPLPMAVAVSCPLLDADAVEENVALSVSEGWGAVSRNDTRSRRRTRQNAGLRTTPEGRCLSVRMLHHFNGVWEG